LLTLSQEGSLRRNDEAAKETPDQPIVKSTMDGDEANEPPRSTLATFPEQGKIYLLPFIW
jgi:hypothetical protein